MKNIKVDLLHFTPSSVIVEAVGLPHKLKKPTIEIATKVIAKLHHTSVSEHCTMNFKITGIARLCMLELERHRITSTTASSSRYILMQLLKEFGHIEQIENDLEEYDEDCKNVMGDVINYNFTQPTRPDYITDDNDWTGFLTVLKRTNKNCLHNMEYFKKQGFKPDILKYLLTENFRISLVWTINLRSLLNFLSLRLDKSAHFEICYLAGLIKSEACRVPYINNIIKIIDKQNEELQTKIDFYDDMSKIIVNWASNICIEDSKFYEKDFNDKIVKCIVNYFDMRQINYFKTHNILDHKIK